jgi:hypothetical protein
MGSPHYLPLGPKYGIRTHILFPGEGPAVPNLSWFAAHLVSQQFFHDASRSK